MQLRAILALALSFLFMAPMIGGCPSESELAGNQSNNGGDSSAGGPSDGPGGVVAGETVDDSAVGDGVFANDVDVVTPKGQPVEIVLSGSADSGLPLHFGKRSDPAVGTLGPIEQRDAVSASVIYDPPDDFVGQVSFRYVTFDGSVRSNEATVTITVYPPVCYDVDPLEGPRGVTRVARAFTTTGDPLPEGEYTWLIDDVPNSGPLATHSEIEVNFETGGRHTIKLNLAIAGLAIEIACAAVPGSFASASELTIAPSISGAVLDSTGRPLPNINVIAGEANGKTDATGRFTIDVPAGWTGTVAPSSNEFSFNPTAWSYTNVQNDIRGADFTATAKSGSGTIAISGYTRTSAGVGIGSVTVSSSDGIVVLTDTKGFYSLSVTAPWSGTITPSKAGYAFTPPNRSYLARAQDDSTADFTGTLVSGGSNQPPQAISKSVSTNEDVTLAIQLSASDPDDDLLFYTVTSLPQHGVLKDAGNGKTIASTDLPYTLTLFGKIVNYTPASHYNGADAFSFRVNDGSLNSNSATVSITVNGTNDVPVVTPGGPLSLSVEKNTPATDPANDFDLRATDGDAAPNSLVWSICTQATHGVASIESGSPSSSNGSIIVNYQPATNYIGADAFSVCVDDGQGGSDTVLVSVSVVDPTPPNTYYVDANNPNASDNNAGTEVLPFKTITKAINLVKAGDTVYVKAGTYAEGLSIRASGTASKRITIRNYANDRVIIDGGNARSWPVIIGRNDPNHVYGHYVTFQGFTIRNPQGEGFGPGTSDHAGMLILGTEGVIVRGCRVYRDDYPGYPNAAPPLAYKAKGIIIRGYNVDTLIENCHVHHLVNGIGSRLSDGDVGGYPSRVTLRWNHIHHINIDDFNEQNNATSSGFSNGTEYGVAEYNLVHHSADNAIGTDDCNGHIIQRNIVYLSGWNAPGGNGAGIKTKPTRLLVPDIDIVRYNVSLLCREAGIEINQPSFIPNPKVYNNLSYGNGAKGITVTTATGPTRAAWVYNNVAVGNAGKDINYTAIAGVKDYNFVEDGVNDGAISPHTLSGNPQWSNLGLLSVDTNADGTPDVFDVLNDPEAFPDAQSAYLYARDKIALIFKPAPGSPLIDAGLTQVAGIPDFLDLAPYDDLTKADPWSGDGDPGLFDIGPIEYRP